MNRLRFHHLSRQPFTPDTRALLAYGLVVVLGTVAMLAFTAAPFAHVPMGI